MKWFLHVLKHYADFSGRARRTEYWMYILFVFILLIAALIVGIPIGALAGGYSALALYYMVAMALQLPGLAVAARRLHDIGKSGWWLLIGLIPFIGGIWLLVLVLTDSQPGDNKYGPNPKEAGELPYPKEKKTMSAGIAMIVGASCSIIVVLFWWFVLRLLSGDQIIGFANLGGYFLSRLLPLAAPLTVFIAGIALVQKKANFQVAAIAFLVGGAIWVVNVSTTFFQPAEFLSLSRIISAVISLVVPAAIIMVGLGWLQKKENMKTEATLLTVAVILSLCQTLYWAIVSMQSYNELGDLFYELFQMLDVITSISLLALAYAIRPAKL